MIFSLHYNIFTALLNLTTSVRFYSLNPSSFLYVILIFLPTLRFTFITFAFTGYLFLNSLSEAMGITSESPYLPL
jgi:hypothetical protein